MDRQVIFPGMVILALGFALTSLEAVGHAQGTKDHEKIEALINSLAKINVPDPADDPIVPRHSTGYEGSGPDRRETFEQKNKLTETLEQFIAFDPQAVALWPGSLVQGKDLPFGNLTPIAPPRTPLRIAVTGLVSSDPNTTFSATVADPAIFGAVGDAVTKILSQNLNKEQPAQFAYTKTEVHSVKEAFLRLGASYGWAVGHVNGSFQSSSDVTRSRFMVRFVQRYYTVSCEPQSSPAAFVSETAKYADFAHYVGAGNPPTYVASVTYGRELWMLIESSSSSSDIQAALDAAFAGGSVNVSGKQSELLNESSIQVMVVGGGGTPAIRLLTGDKVNAIAGFLKEGANYSKESPGAIISYVVRYMVDNSIARVSSSADYMIRTSVSAPELSIIGLHMSINTGDDDKDDDNHVSIRITLQPENLVLYYDPDIPPRQGLDNDPTWHDGDNRPIDVRLPNPVLASDPGAKSIQVAISKSGGAHWHFGFELFLKFSNDRTIAVASHDRNAHNFGGNYNSDSWTFTIPWTTYSQQYLQRRWGHLKIPNEPESVLSKPAR